jgi:uncharacterized membrane protein YheB (UPF0754 family)
MLKSEQMIDGMSIYVCSDLLRYFVIKIMPFIKKRFTLVSGDSDLCVPFEILKMEDFQKIVNNEYLIRWFIQNTRNKTDKITQLPIGLDYHTVSNNPSHVFKKDSEGHLPENQEEILMSIREQVLPFYKRINKIYVNFSIVTDRFGQRKEALEKISTDLMVINKDFIKRTDTWNNMKEYSFVLSPFGNGMDCHRTWEALCLGCIPILKAPSFKNMFEDLPVLIVNDWSEITQELLNDTLNTFEKQKLNFNYDKLTLNYWVSKINNTPSQEEQ